MGAHHSKEQEDHVCPTHDLFAQAPSPLYGSTSFYEFNKILSGSCMAFSILVVAFHLIRHATHFSNPSEQAKIMKVGLLLPLYVAYSYISICFPQTKVYLHPWVDFFQAHALASFFLLLCELVSPSPDQRDIFFAALTIPDKKRPNGRHLGLEWYRNRWIMIFQYPVVALVTAVLTDITEAAGIYCEYETKPYFAKLWIGIARNVSLSLAVTAVMIFANILKPHLAEQRPLAKLAAIKLIVFLAFLQTIIFWILEGTGNLNPTSKLTYADINMGVPGMLTCIEMVPISFLMLWAYPVRPYRLGQPRKYAAAEAGEEIVFRPSNYQGGPFGLWAFLAMLNPRDGLEGLAFAFKMATEGRYLKKETGYPSAEYNVLLRPDAVAQR